jgi:hypothetical protein
MFQICVLIKKLKKKNQLETFLNAMIKNIKIHNFLILLKFQNLWNFLKYTFKYIYI